MYNLSTENDLPPLKMGSDQKDWSSSCKYIQKQNTEVWPIEIAF